MPHRAIDAVWRIESARLIAGLARIVRDVGLAEELAQDALVAALEQWPESGVPDNPGAWLMATAKHRAIDLLRRGKTARAQARGARSRARGRSRHGRAGPRRRARRRRRRRPPAPHVHGLPSGALDRGARRAHAPPARRPDDRRDRARVPRPGADRRPADRPGQADARRGARPVRGARAAPSSPRACRRCSRSSTSSSTRATRRPPATTGCGRRSARTRCASAASWPSSCPDEPEVHGLVALMEIQASRSRARVGPSGEPDPAARPEPRALGPPPHPPRSRGARAGRAARRRARARTRSRPRSPPVTRGRATPEETDWARIVALYDALAELVPSPVVELNRAVAVAMAFGPAAGLELVDALTSEPSLESYHLLAERARRPARQARPPRRGARGVRARGGAHAERPRARAAPRARGRLRRCE